MTSTLHDFCHPSNSEVLKCYASDYLMHNVNRYPSNIDCTKFKLFGPIGIYYINS